MTSPHGNPTQPRVWLDMDQAGLDAAYDQNRYAPNREQILGRFASNSVIVRDHLGPPRRLEYGPGRMEGVDVYLTEQPNAPVHVFIHGGAWRSGVAADYAFAAEMVVRAGAHFVVPDYDWVQDCGGDLLPLADQVKRAIAFVWRNAAGFGGDPERIYLSAHSSGSHLSAVALTEDWPTRFDAPPDIIKGALLCSGMYDLRPVRLSARSSYVTITDDTEQALSPARHLDAITTPLILAHGTLETPEFQRQTRDFAAALIDKGHPVDLIVAKGHNHFEILETLANPYGLLGRAALGQMGLTGAPPMSRG